MGSENLLRGVATLVGGGFIVYAAVAIVRGTSYDSDDGPLDRATQRGGALAFWLSVVATTLLGLFILGVGHRWAIGTNDLRACRPAVLSGRKKLARRRV